MKRVYITALAMILGISLYAQRRALPIDQVLVKHNSKEIIKQEYHSADITNIPEASELPPSAIGAHAGKTAAMAAVPIGSATNAYSIIRGEGNQIWANDALNTVVFIHRQNTAIWGGGTTENGKFRYDVSIDGGATFSTDIGVLNSVYTFNSRYPNISGFLPTDTSVNPFDAKLSFLGATLDNAPDWDGHVNGISELKTSTGATAGTENYDLVGGKTLIPGGLCNSDSGTFWAVDIAYDKVAGATEDTIYIYRGDYVDDTATGEDIVWVRSHSIALDNYKGFDGTSIMLGPNIAFSPDGSIGYVAWLGDLNGQSMDTSVIPCYIKSIDGGISWSQPAEIDMASIPGMKDSLQVYWDDTTGLNPAGSGRPTTGFDYDIVVDSAGDLHFFTIIGNSSYTYDSPSTPDDDRIPGYSMLSGIELYAMDFHGGHSDTTWNGFFVSPVMGFRWDNGFDQADDDYISMDNFPQASRSEDGSKIFYSWTDSDGVNEFCDQAGPNDFPDLRVASWDIGTGNRTDIKKISDGDIVYEGSIYFPAMAPTVLSGSGTYNLPIVFLQFRTASPLDPCDFFYAGNDAQLMDADYVAPSSLNIHYGNICLDVGVEELDILPGDLTLTAAYPNPTKDLVNIGFELTKTASVEVSVMNLFGQKILDGENTVFPAGKHVSRVDVSDLAPGVYLVSLRSGNYRATDKVVIMK